jgi:hypothetical protein
MQLNSACKNSEHIEYFAKENTTTMSAMTDALYHLTNSCGMCDLQALAW